MHYIPAPDTYEITMKDWSRFNRIRRDARDELYLSFEDEQFLVGLVEKLAQAIE